MPVNPNEAPEGFEAVKAVRLQCRGCYFHELDRCSSVPCVDQVRADNVSVIFVPSSRIMATANWPHDDMGTPV